MKILKALFLSLAIFLINPLSADDGSPVKVGIAQEQTIVSPGSEFRVLLTFDLDASWHLYWKNPGDSGMAPSIEWKLPEGVQLSAEEWPAPEKYEQQGIISYGYEGKIPLVAIFRIAPDFKGDLLNFSADLSWVVCSSDTCLPGSQAVQAKLKVGPHAEFDEKVRPLFESALSHLPEKITPLSAGFNGKMLTLALPIQGATEAEFYPEAESPVDHHQPASAVPADEQGISLITLTATQEKPAPVRGILKTGGKTYAVQAYLPSVEDDALISVADLPKEVGGALSYIPTESGSQETLSLGWALLFSLLGGLLLNLMPCVLPVVSLKILNFVQISGESRKLIFKHGAYFSLGVLVSFWCLAGALIILQKSGQAVGWGFQLQEPFFIALLSMVFVLLGLSLFGVFEFGTSVASMAGSVAADTRKQGVSGSFWSGVFATAVATPCTGPFMGSALGYALTQPPYVALLVFTTLGIGMSLPYLLLALNPAMIRWMPKPGAWMESFKQMMGFLMMATTLWLLWVFTGQMGENPLFILAFALLAASVAAWVYGKWGVPYKSNKVRRFAYVISAVILSLSVWLAYTASRDEISSSSSQEIASAESGWEPFSKERVEELRAQNIPVFIDFTAKWCLICQANHLTISQDTVSKKMQAAGVVRMKADWTKYDPEITAELKRFGRSGVPLYVYYGSGQKEGEILPQVLTADGIADVIEKSEGKRDVR